MSITVIIINWNSGSLLAQCLACLLKQSRLPAHILVMDNGSTDGSVISAQNIPQVTVHSLASNIGFAAANNKALAECTTEYVALLNPDAFPEPDWLARLIADAQAHPEVAAFGSRQMMYGNTGTLDGIGDVYHFSGLVWRAGYGRRLRAEDSNAMDIFSPCAGAALFRLTALVDIGGFDEDFFCYVEDVDLGFRLRLAGQACRYVPDAVVNHIGSGTTGGKHSDFSIYYGHRNLIWAFVKNMPGVLFWLLLPAHVLMNLITVAYFVSSGHGKVILRSKWEGLKGIRKMWRKRRAIQVKRRVSTMAIWRILDKRLIPSLGRHNDAAS